MSKSTRSCRKQRPKLEVIITQSAQQCLNSGKISGGLYKSAKRRRRHDHNAEGVYEKKYKVSRLGSLGSVVSSLAGSGTAPAEIEFRVF